MTQEEKELLLKDICARLPYGVIMTNKLLKETYYPLDGNDYQQAYYDNDWDDVPYLRPMSSMTKEEAKEIATLHDIKDILSVNVTSDYIDFIVDDGFCSTERRTIWYDEIVSSIKCFDWLNAHYFDYRGLIPMGLALEATEEMYKTN